MLYKSTEDPSNLPWKRLNVHPGTSPLTPFDPLFYHLDLDHLDIKLGHLVLLLEKIQAVGTISGVSFMCWDY